ncbi:FAD-dependent oxidoreductase [Starkeya sp. ORNL1]|jgi:ribulose 1,5-bisphosphate synthetase/thiazole synthase|uniref:FAD-dependent oxidoreductase n=1 Tax=Starkeya sp. ORNL1 TaxID=2709380 RepID=UPI001462B836|nr:FAD-dependent oxidoreductase [Starkeya sp. ORNL1]QJP16110.1 FAD-dependent oxidoreductase [Starkeya sp. ORNL1]
MPLVAKKQHSRVDKDVIVVGGGTAGFVAAISAARNGASVLLLEQRDHLGGTHTGGMVMMIRSMRHMAAPKTLDEKKLFITGYESSFENEQLVRSIAQEYIDRMISVESAWGQKGQAATRQMFDPEIGKWVIEQMVQEAGVEVWLNTAATDVIMEGNALRGVVIETLRDRVEVHARVTIDTTGDGEIAAAAGASYEKGSPEDGRHQPLSLYFAVGGVNLEKTLQYMKDHPDEFGREYVETTLRLKAENKPFTMFPFKEKVREAIKNGDYPIPYGLDKIDPDAIMYVVRTMYRNGKFRYDFSFHNMDMAYNIDGTDRIALSKATLAMRELANKMAIFYRKYVPGYEDSYMAYTAQSVGVRDTRRIVGEYTLTDDDVLYGRSFDDGIGRYGSVMDVHDKSGKKSVSLVEVGGQGWFHVPYRTLVPKDVDNILVAGRCISAEYHALGSVRSQAASMVTGQAVGTAAAISARSNTNPRLVDIAKLQETLREQDQII